MIAVAPPTLIDTHELVEGRVCKDQLLQVIRRKAFRRHADDAVFQHGLYKRVPFSLAPHYFL